MLYLIVIIHGYFFLDKPSPNEYNQTCVENCSDYEREPDNDNPFVCKALEKSNGTNPDNKKKEAGTDYLLWIFIAVISILLIIITICICKKCCGEKGNLEITEEISTETELNEKEPDSIN